MQCKFYDRSVSKTELSDINIPTLIHEYGAHGYLLVCKGGVTSTVSTMFENLRKKRREHYKMVFIKNGLLIYLLQDSEICLSA